MAVAELKLLGVFELRLSDGRLAELPGPKDRALLAVLALTPGAPHTRDRLAGFLWSDRDDPRARDSLKHALSRLRRGLGWTVPHSLVADRQSVRLDPRRPVSSRRRSKIWRRRGPRRRGRGRSRCSGATCWTGSACATPPSSSGSASERQRLRGLRRRRRRGSSRAGSPDGARAARHAGCSRSTRSRIRLPRPHACIRARPVRPGSEAVRDLRDRLHAELGVRPEAETMRLPRNAAPADAPGGPSGAGVATPELLPCPQALDRRPALRQYERRSRAGLFRRRHGGGDHHRAVAHALAVRDRPQFQLHLQGPRRRREAGRARARRALRAGRQRAQGRRTGCASPASSSTPPTGAHLWADRFDGALEDIFDLQDQVTASVVGAIAPKLEQAEIERAKRKPTESLDAYDYFLRGMAAVHRWTREAMQRGAAAVRPRDRARSRISPRPTAWRRAATRSARPAAG